MNIIDAIHDPALFAPWFSGKDASPPAKTEGGAAGGISSSYTSWLTYFSALFALPLNPEQQKIYTACTGRETPPEKVSTWSTLICGRRAGKSFALALIATYLACFGDYKKYLAPGERGTIMVIASDKKQARVIMQYIAALLTGIPMLEKLIDKRLAEAFHLKNCVTIEIQTASFRRVRGYSILAALCDEIAFWRNVEDSTNPDHEILDAIRPAMSTIPDAMLLCASSPYARRGALWDAFNKYYGKENAPCLVWRASTRVMNPTVPQSVIDEARERDPAHASAEYDAQFRTDIENYLPIEAIRACVVEGLHERPPERQHKYYAHIDPAGGTGQDSFCLAIAHRETDTLVLDLIRERQPKFSPEQVCEEFASICRKYRITKCVGDRWGGDFPREQMRKHGVNYELSEKTASQLFIDLLPIINSGACDILDSNRLVGQLGSLERKLSRGGRDIISHGPNGHDDIAVVLAGSFSQASTSTPAYMRRTSPPNVLLGYAHVKTGASYGPRKGQRKDYSEHYTNRSGEYGEYGGPGGRLRGRLD